MDERTREEREKMELFAIRSRDGGMYWSTMEAPLVTLFWDLAEFNAAGGRYGSQISLPFANEDVLLGMPENFVIAQPHLPRLGLPEDLVAGYHPGDPLPIWHMEKSRSDGRIPSRPLRENRASRLGRVGGREATSKEPAMITFEGEFIHRNFETHGRLTSFIDQTFFMKRRIEQDLTAFLNEHFKDMPEFEVPCFIPFVSALRIVDQQLPNFKNQIDRRDTLDHEAALRGFAPASRLETNVIESEIQRRKGVAESRLSKRSPDLDDKEIVRRDRMKKSQAAYMARKRGGPANSRF